MSSPQGFATARFRLADLLLIQPHQVAAQRRPRTEERPRRQDQGSEGLTNQRPVTEEMTLPGRFPGVSGVTVRLMSDGELTRFEVLRDLDQKRLMTAAAAQLLGSGGVRCSGC